MISIANVLSAQFEKATALFLADFNHHEIRIVKDVIASLKKRLRRDAGLRAARKNVDENILL